MAVLVVTGLSLSQAAMHVKKQRTLVQPNSRQYEALRVWAEARGRTGGPRAPSA